MHVEGYTLFSFFHTVDGKSEVIKTRGPSSSVDLADLDYNPARAASTLEPEKQKDEDGIRSSGKCNLFDCNSEKGGFESLNVTFFLFCLIRYTNGRKV